MKILDFLNRIKGHKDYHFSVHICEENVGVDVYKEPLDLRPPIERVNFRERDIEMLLNMISENGKEK